jgi:hypothetical protein
MMIVHNYKKKKKERKKEKRNGKRKKLKVDKLYASLLILVYYKNFYFVGNYDILIILS